MLKNAINYVSSIIKIYFEENYAFLNIDFFNNFDFTANWTLTHQFVTHTFLVLLSS